MEIKEIRNRLMNGAVLRKLFYAANSHFGVGQVASSAWYSAKALDDAHDGDLVVCVGGKWQNVSLACRIMVSLLRLGAVVCVWIDEDGKLSSGRVELEREEAQV